MTGLVWSPGMTLEAIEKEVILQAFRFYRGNKTVTAQALGISVRTLDNKFIQYKEDDTHHEKRATDERAKREEFQRRQRGMSGSDIHGFSGSDGNAANMDAFAGHGAHAGVRLESAAHATAQSDVSLSERKEIQGVLPKQAAQSGAGKRR